MHLKHIEPTPSAHGYPLLVKTLLRQPMTDSRQNEIVYRDQVRYDYDTLERRIARLANALEGLGLSSGQTVGIMDYDSHRFLEAFFAVPMMGCVLHTLNFNRAPQNLAHVINHAGDDIILIHEELLPILEGVRTDLSAPIRFVVLSDAPEPPSAVTDLPVAGDYESLLAAASDSREFPDFDENAAATALYTVGAGGDIHGVYYSHRQIVIHTYGIMAALTACRFSPGVNSGDVFMPLTPMFHLHAWGLPYLFTMLRAKQVYPGRFQPEEASALIEREGVTFSNCLPTLMHQMVETPAVASGALNRWRVVIGGSALSESLCRTALEKGIDIYSVYGKVETGPMLAASFLKPALREASEEEQIAVRCRTGHPIPMVEMRIMGRNGEFLPHDGNSIGEVVVRAPWLAQGYLNDGKRSAALWEGGWLHTGDMGFIDPEGYLQITDRLIAGIKTAGEWIATVELENVIEMHPAVREVAVTAIPDEKLGEKPIAFVVLDAAEKDYITEEDIRKFCTRYVENGTLPVYGVPDQVVIVDVLPSTAVGKIDKRQLMRGRDVSGED